MINDVKWYHWLRYSGASLTLHLNPLYWWTLPKLSFYPSEFGGIDKRWEFKFIFLKLTWWIDNGQW